MLSAGAGATVARAEPGMALAIDPTLALFILVGLPIGIMFRTARMIDARRERSAIWRDLAVSILISGANFVLAAMIAVRLELTYLEALALSVIVAATGVKALVIFTQWAWRRLVQSDVAEMQGERRQAAQRELSKQRIIDGDNP